jgi:phosphate starvation-inducible PhoH-like protein
MFILFFTLFCVVSSKKNNIHKISVQSKTPTQKKYLDILTNPEISVVVGLGPAGTGKTFLSCHTAVQQLKNGNIKKIIITRPTVSVEENMGYLPGSITEKMDPYTRPIFDAFSSTYDNLEISSLMKRNILEISPLGFMRGRTFDNSYIIADEMQNSTPAQMKMLLTRVGENSKLVITGDLDQSDLGYKNGLRDFYDRILNKKFKNISLVSFLNKDIQRSEIVKTIVKIYEST